MKFHLLKPQGLIPFTESLFFIKNLNESIKRLDTILQPCSIQDRKTKIVATVGPASNSVEMLSKLIDAGVNCIRLNFSHGTHESHAKVLANLTAAMKEHPHKHIAVMLDTKGPEIRTGYLVKSPVTIKKGSIVELTTDYEFKGNEKKLAISYKSLPKSVKVGQNILIADGSLVMKVTEILPEGVKCEAQNEATIGETKNCNLPGVHVDLPVATERDINDLQKFGIAHNVDYIAASFIRKPEDIDQIRKILGPRGRQIKIIAKIENQEGLENYDEILKKTDGIMVARGDMGMEIPPEKVFLAQKMMIRKANLVGKPVITATQMLESMITHPRPTRAEASDVANAVLDGSDCVMLSGESANGQYPIEAVTIMARIVCEAENTINYDHLYTAIRNSSLAENGELSIAESIASSAVKSALDVKAKIIIVLTETGRTAQCVAKYRPPMRMVVLTPSESTARQCEGYIRGATTRVTGSMIGSASLVENTGFWCKEQGWCNTGDNIVAVYGMKEAISGMTDTVKIFTLPPN